MSIIPSHPPAACAAAFSAQLPAFLSGSAGLKTPTFVGQPPSIPSPADIGTGILAAIEVFGLSLQTIVDDPTTFNPTPAGWQLFAGAVTSPPQVVSGLMKQNRHTGAWKLASVSYGSIVRDRLDDLNNLGSVPGLSPTDDYETFLVEIPGVNLRTFWLVPQKHGSPDWIRPIPAGPSQRIPALKSPNVYEVGTVLATLLPMATANLGMGAHRGA